jgi:hypothetical protein
LKMRATRETVPVLTLRRSPDPLVYRRTNRGHKLRGQKSHGPEVSSCATHGETMRLMEAIDAEFEARGGWPLG